jgi:signal transduction histidine kinase
VTALRTALVDALADPSGRATAAKVLAQAIGAEALLVLVRDPQSDALVMAKGFAQTLPGGPEWPAFLATCKLPGEHTGIVSFPGAGHRKVARARMIGSGTVFVLVGADAELAQLDELPLLTLSSLFCSEYAGVVARSEVAIARESARHARMLAGAVEAARAESARALAETARLNRELEVTAQFREQLIGIVSHDLRNPLSAIAMAAEIMLRRGQLPEADLKRVTLIANSTNRVGRMIEELLDFTRSRLGGGIELRCGPANLFQICRQVVGEAEMAHPERRIDFVSEGDGDGIWDPGRLSQVVSNLVGNAVQHGAPATPVRVAIRGDEDMTIEVQNEGTPIPPMLLPHIFDPFRRGPETDGPRQGLGLGLYITSQLVKAHGGRLEVRSDAADGTTFRVRLPRITGVPQGGVGPELKKG